ncbi:unnamed protein product, partial [Musa textilis]
MDCWEFESSMEVRRFVGSSCRNRPRTSRELAEGFSEVHRKVHQKFTELA